jgi:hypothetical protein
MQESTLVVGICHQMPLEHQCIFRYTRLGQGYIIHPNFALVSIGVVRRLEYPPPLD